MKEPELKKNKIFLHDCEYHFGFYHQLTR